MKRFNLVVLTAILMAGIFQLNAQSNIREQIESKVDALIPDAVNDSTAGLVVGVIFQGELILNKGYGMANLAYNIPNDPSMRYNIGSVTKQFLGFAFAMLASEDQINLDAPVSQFLEDWPEFEDTVRVIHLLSHTSGYREAYTMSSLAGRSIGVDRLSREECLEVVRRQERLEFEPGSKYTYNSTAWVILAEIFQKVTGTTAEKWIETNIFKPLKMNDTQIESYVGEVIENAAESYTVNWGKGIENPKSNRAIFGAADIYTSINDLAKWINNFRTTRVGGTKARDIFLNPFILNDGSNSGYALGIGIGEYRGLPRYRHTGGHEAFITQLSFFPDQDLGIVTVSNFGGYGRIMTSDIAEIILEPFFIEESKEVPNAIELDSAQMVSYTGTYMISSYNQTIEIKKENGSLKFNNTSIIPISDNDFRVAGSDTKLFFEQISDSTKMLTIDDGSKTVFYQLSSWEPESDKLKEYEGDYWSKELETVYHIESRDNKLVVNHRWLAPLELNPVAKDYFRAGRGVFVKFNRNMDGDIIDLSVYTGRTLDVRFERQGERKRKSPKTFFRQLGF